MSNKKHDYTPDFDSERFPVWYIDTDQTIAYHLYPDCSHIDHKSLREFSKATILSLQASNAETLEDWKSQIRSNRHMCKHCVNQLMDDWRRSHFD